MGYELSMAQIQGHLMLHKNDPKGALEGVPKFLEEVKIKAGEIQAPDLPIYDHLRRLNLHRWAWLFEYYGYHMVSDLRDVKADTINKWTLDFQLDSRAFRTLKTLFEKNLPKEYPLSEYLHIRDTFIRTFYRQSTGGTEKGDILAIGAAPVFRKQKSMEEQSLDELTAQFCDIVCPGRKSLISKYQLDYHLKRFPDAVLAVQYAHLLVEAREDFEPHWPSAFGFACRVGCKEAKWKLEEEEIKFQHELADTEEDDLKDIFGKENLPRVKCILKSESNKIFRREFELISFADAQSLVRQYFPSNVSLAYEFADKLVDPFGHGKVSVMQVKTYLKEKHENINNILNDIEELLNPVVEKVEVKEEPKEDPTDMMFKILKAHGCEEFYDKFADANIFEMNLNHPFNGNILAKLGISKFGDQWKLLDIFTKEAEKLKEENQKEEEVEAKEDEQKVDEKAGGGEMEEPVLVG